MTALGQLETESTIIVERSATMMQLADAMSAANAATALVIEGDTPVGIVTERDIIAQICSNVEWPSLLAVDVMTQPVVHVPANTSDRAGYELMTEHSIRHLVIDADDNAGFRVIGEQAFASFDRRRNERAGNRVSAIMQYNPPRLPPDAAASDAIDLMQSEQIDFVLITHNERAIGIVTERDLLQHCRSLAEDLETRIDRFMSSPVLTISDEAPLDSALDAMENYQVRRLAVVGLDSHLLGVLTLHQLVAYQQRRFIQTLKADLDACAAQAFPGQLLDAIGDGVLIIERGSRRIIEANARIAGWLGYDIDRLSGMRLDECLGEEAEETAWGAEQDVTPIESCFMTWLRRSDGSSLPAEVTIKRVTFREQPLVVAVARDLRERNAMSKALRASEQRLRLVANVFDNGCEGVIITDTDSRIVEVNPAFTQITGYAPEDVIGRKPGLLSSGRHDEPFYQGMWRSLQVAGSWRGEIWNRRKNGEVYPEWLSISAVYNDDGDTENYVAVFSDISEQHRSREELEYLAHHDALTQLPNRLLFNARLDHAITHARRARSELAVLFIDVDRFKTINDSLGHTTGDQVLQLVARRLRDVLRADDTMARQGGDEFIILLENVTPRGVTEVSEKLSAALSTPLQIDGHPIYLSLSIGITMFPRDGTNADTLIRNADAAMYRAKDSGRDNCQFYTPDMTDEALEQILLHNHLRQAVERDEFRVFYQPQVDIETGRAVGVEALLRWQHPTEGLVPPKRFLTLLEDQGLMRQVGPWVLEQACKDYVRWQQAGCAPRLLAVNLSGVQIHAPDAVDTIARIVADTGMPTEHLELEVTETFVMGDPESNINTLHKLRALGIRLAIDDFGTGYSSLTYLKRLPINKLKIDRSFVADVPGDVDDEAITRAIIGLGKTLNLDIIAEGVERKTGARFLIDEGCYQGQGYLWARPMPIDEVTAWLEQHI
jgi:diguanylate cyclase (GGDEF)-like protein/PAS domain S-box-containing protein